ncbi:MAG: M20/M25/M40 family metallo-hydrolase [Fimbriimonadaceae bacterium]
MRPNEDRLISLFMELCLIDAPALREKVSVEFTKHHLQHMGLEVWEDGAGAKIGGNANNLIARLAGNKPGAPKVYLSAHFDTVEPTAGLQIEERNGVFYSDGTTILGADDKAGMAPAIEAVHMLMESNEPHGDVYLLLTCAEEIGLKGAAALEIEKLGLDFGYVLDTGPPVGSFVTRTANHDKINFTVIGKPAHAGKDPEKGINAIEVAAEAISNIKSGRVGPETTANFGIIHGGSAVNVVCPSVTVFGEARSTSIAELDAQIAHMRGAFESACSKWGADLVVEYERHYVAYQIPDDAPVVRHAVAAAQEMGFPGTLRTTLGGSDANIFNQKGVPSIVIATGMEQIHTHEEHVSRKDLLDTAELTYRILLAAAR